MFKKLLRSIGWFLVLLTLVGCSKYNLRGDVTDKATGLPLEGVTVTLVVDEEERQTTTNRRGNYRIAKDRQKLGLLKAEKEGYESYSVDKIGYEKDLSFWLRPTAEETVKRIITLEQAGAQEDSKKWEELYRTYLHPNYQAEFPLPLFLEKEQAYQTFYSLLVDAEPEIKEVIMLTNWRDEHQHKVYKEVKKVTVELTTKVDEQESKVTKEFYLAHSQQYWHFFWIGR